MPVTNPQKGLPQHPKIEIRSAPLPTLWQRLRQIKKKDLAFILAGLAILILAPVAQHFLLAPSGDAGLEPGFSTREGEGGKGGQVFEPGLGGFAPGQQPGSPDVITPLSSRDPSSLLMPPGGPPAPPKTSAADNIRDALNRALREGSSKAVESAGFPQPSPRLASTLRGLAALAGAGGNNVAPLPLGGGGAVLQGAQSVPNQAAPRAFAGPYAPPDLKGGLRGIDSANTGEIEALKAAADKAASHFNGPGTAAQALEAAARDSVHPGGGSGVGGSGQGDGGSDKAHAGNNYPPGKYELGENLQYELAKMRAQKELDLLYKKREMMEMLPYKFMDKFFDMAMDKIVGDGYMKWTGDCIGKSMSGKSCWSKSSNGYACLQNGHKQADFYSPDDVAYVNPSADGQGVIYLKTTGTEADGKSGSMKVVCQMLAEVGDVGDKKPSEPDTTASGQDKNTGQLLADLGIMCETGASQAMKDAACSLLAAEHQLVAARDDLKTAGAGLADLRKKDADALLQAHNAMLEGLVLSKPGNLMEAYTTWQQAPKDAADAAKADLSGRFARALVQYKASLDTLKADADAYAQGVKMPLDKATDEMNTAQQKLKDGQDNVAKFGAAGPPADQLASLKKQAERVKATYDLVNSKDSGSPGSLPNVSLLAQSYSDKVYRELKPKLDAVGPPADAFAGTVSTPSKKPQIEARWKALTEPGAKAHDAVDAFLEPNGSNGGGAPQTTASAAPSAGATTPAPDAQDDSSTDAPDK